MSIYILANRLIKLTHCDIIEHEKGVYTTTTSHHHRGEMTFIFLNTRQENVYIFVSCLCELKHARPILYPQWLIQPLGVVVIGGGGGSTRVLVWIIVTDVRSLGSSGLQYVNQSECVTVLVLIFSAKFKFHHQTDKIIAKKLKSVPEPSSDLSTKPYNAVYGLAVYRNVYLYEQTANQLNIMYWMKSANTFLGGVKKPLVNFDMSLVTSRTGSKKSIWNA